MTIVIIVLIYQLFTLSQRWLFCTYQLNLLLLLILLSSKILLLFCVQMKKMREEIFFCQAYAKVLTLPRVTLLRHGRHHLGIVVLKRFMLKRTLPLAHLFFNKSFIFSTSIVKAGLE